MGIGLVVSSLEDVICNWGCRGLPDRPSPQILYCHVLKFSWLFAFNVSPARKLSSSSSPLPNVPFFKVQALPLLRLLLASLPSVPRLLIMAHKNSKPEKNLIIAFFINGNWGPERWRGAWLTLHNKLVTGPGLEPGLSDSFSATFFLPS